MKLLTFVENARGHVPFLLPAVMLTTSCSTYRPDPFVNRIKGDVALTTTADVSHALLIETPSGRKVCVQPPADASFDAKNSKGTEIAIVALGGNQGAKEESASDTGERQFQGRTPSVLITREVFYRLCEMTINQNLSKDEALQSFDKAVSALSPSWREEATRTTVAIVDDVVEGTGSAAASSNPPD